MKLTLRKNKEFRINTGLELFYNYSIVDCKNDMFTKDSKTEYSYSTANYYRNKYGANIFFSLTSRKGMFFIEFYWGMVLAADYNVKLTSISQGNFVNDRIFGIGVRSYATHAENIYIKPNFILGLKIGYNFINK